MLRGLHARWRRRFRTHRLQRPVPIRSGRRLLLQGFGLLAAGGGLLGWLLSTARSRLPVPNRKPVRPPTAGKDERRFQGACIRCGLCGTVCENGCIRYFGADEPRWGALTPYLDVRERSCTLCMRCTQVCPTSALTHLDKGLESAKQHVRMGLAVVDAERCLSFLGRVCGYCHDACPLPGHALRLAPPAKPIVIVDGCVGCGRCVEHCPQSPTAIDVWRLS